MDPIVTVLADSDQVPEIVPATTTHGGMVMGMEWSSIIASVWPAPPSTILANVAIPLVDSFASSIPVRRVLPLVVLGVIIPIPDSRTSEHRSLVCVGGAGVRLLGLALLEVLHDRFPRCLFGTVDVEEFLKRQCRDV